MHLSSSEENMMLGTIFISFNFLEIDTASFFPSFVKGILVHPVNLES